MRSSSVGPLLYSGTETRAVTMVTHCFAECGPDEMIFEKITSWVFCSVTPISCYSGDMLNPPLVTGDYWDCYDNNTAKINAAYF